MVFYLGVPAPPAHRTILCFSFALAYSVLDVLLYVRKLAPPAVGLSAQISRLFHSHQSPLNNAISKL